jgi:hypothetical protein
MYNGAIFDMNDFLMLPVWLRSVFHWSIIAPGFFTGVGKKSEFFFRIAILCDV